MAASRDSATWRVGFWAAVLSTVFSLAYIVAQLAEWAGLLGSGGGAESASTVLGLIVLLVPSFFLGSSFVVLMACVHLLAPPERHAWTLSALAFATMYAVLTGTVYFVQLTLVAPRMLAGRTAGIEMFRFEPFDSFLYSVDILGYSFMSLSTLIAAMAFNGMAFNGMAFSGRGGVQRVARGFLLANGLLLPFIALQIYVHDLIWIAALWAITFPGATWALAVLFHRRAPVAVGRRG